jgi:hypothetical protein
VGIERACSRAEAHGADRLDAEAKSAFEQNLGRFWNVLSEPAFLAGYTSGHGLCERLDRMRARFGLPQFSELERRALAAALDDALADSESVLDELLLAREERIDAR